MPAGGPLPAGSVDARRRTGLRARAVGVAERYALLGFTVLLGVVFSVLPATSATFPTIANLRNVASNQSVVAVAALAAMVPLVCGQFDISIGAVLGVSQVAAAAAMANYGLPVWIAVVIAVAVSCGIGAVNGGLVAYAGINPLIATLGMASLLAGLVSLYTGDRSIVNNIPQSVSNFGAQNFIGLPRTTWLLIAMALVLLWVLRQTPFGRHLTAVGSSSAASRLVGLPVRRLVLSCFVLSGALAGMAGVLQLTTTGSADPVIGPGYTLPALSAAFLGATAIRPGRFNVVGTLVGVAFVAISVNGLTLAGASGWVGPVFNGGALIAAVTLSTAIGRRHGTSG